MRLTPQFSSGALPYVHWHFIHDRLLQLLVMRWHNLSQCVHMQKDTRRLLLRTRGGATAKQCKAESQRQRTDCERQESCLVVADAIELPGNSKKNGEDAQTKDKGS
jgi:hypothetical protein